MIFDIASALLAFAAAVFWFLTSKVAIKTGWDSDEAAQKAFAKIGRLNASAAVLSGLAAGVQAAKYLF
jgi:hypothetical protein